MLVSVSRVLQFATGRVDERVALSRPLDAIGPMQSGVEPLGAVRCRALACDQVTHLVEVGAGISLAGEVAVLPAPVGPGPCESTEEIPPVSFSTHSLFGLYSLKPLVVRYTTLQPDGYIILWHLA